MNSKSFIFLLMLVTSSFTFSVYANAQNTSNSKNILAKTNSKEQENERINFTPFLNTLNNSKELGTIKLPICPDCTTEPKQSATTSIIDGCTTKKLKTSSLCYKYVNKDCVADENGKFIKTLFKKNYTTNSGTTASLSHFIDTPPSDIATACKNYSKLSHEKKEDFWVWVLMSMSMYESTCGYYSVGSNKNAVGPLQLHKSNSDRTARRPKECSDAYIKANYSGSTIKSTKPNLHCGLAMLAVQLAKPGSSGAESTKGNSGLSKGKLFSNGSYWHTLFASGSTPGANTQKLIKKFPGCF